MDFDAFISYPHQDKAMADAACAKLEAEGIRCWVAPRDIAPGADWASSIVDAIDSCRVMVLIFSGHANASRQVHREVQQAFDGEKPLVPFRIENVTPEKSLRYYMGPVHWLDAMTPPIEQHLQELVVSIQHLIREAGTTNEEAPVTIGNSDKYAGQKETARKERIAQIELLIDRFFVPIKTKLQWDSATWERILKVRNPSDSN
jgi:hypothetical protein